MPRMLVLALTILMSSPDPVCSDDPDWWSLRPLTAPAIPVDPTGRARDPIDAFLWGGGDGSPARPTGRRTLARRLYFDLIGLPPPPDETDSFVDDPDPDAYERLVDRLLASPRHGERWGRHWLDVARYADTHGFDKDKLRPNAWPYRDYVIRSLNSDKPYDAFVREQVAGDSFGPDGREGIAALGFLAAGPFDYVGQIEVRDGTVEKRRVRNLDRDEMVSAVMNAFASLTAQCARCHDHKFDPVTQADYYRLQAVFAGVDRADRAYDPDPAVVRRRDALRAREADLRREIADRAGPRLARIDERLSEWEKLPAQPPRPEFGYHSGIEPTADVVKWVQVDLGQAVPVSSIVLAGCHDDFAGIGAGFGFPVRFRVEASSDPEFRDGVIPIADQTGEDYPNPGVRPVPFSGGGAVARFVRVTATKLAHRQNDYIFALGELAVIDGDGNNAARGKPVTSLDSVEAPVRWARENLTDGYHFGAKREGPALANYASLSFSRDEIIDNSTDVKVREELADLARELARTDAELQAVPSEGQVYAAATRFSPQGNFVPTQGKPRPVFVLARGEVERPGEVVMPGAPPLVPGLPAVFELPADHPESARRAALAEWLVSDDNPLTWRSITNRLWQHHFGDGIVATPNDFGRMGAVPTHPGLLDWLAAELRDRGRSLKNLHRSMVTSAAYRSERPPRRLEAEAVRDAILCAAGDLRSDMFGPGFRAFGLKDDHSPHYLYAQHDPADPSSHRRSIYRFVVRSVPDPWMQVRDCADPSASVADRNETVTPLQALSQLNSDFVVTMSRRFAERVSREQGDDPPAIRAFRLAVGREPTPEELSVLTEVADRHGLANACRLIFNLNEFVYVD